MLPFAAVFFSALLVFAAVMRRRHSVAGWSFAAGMATLAAESLVAGVGLNASTLEDALRCQHLGFLLEALLPGIWLCFSLTYSRGNSAAFLKRWRVFLAAAFLFPIGAVIRFPTAVISNQATAGGLPLLALTDAGRILTATFLLAAVLVLTNLETTFRSAVGAMRWRIKFLLLGLAVIFGTRIYTQSQTLLYLRYDEGLIIVESGALIMGCVFIAIAYLRTGLAESDVYPSRAVLQSSVTVLVAGGYLFIVGVLAQIVAKVGGGEYFQLQALLVLIGIASLAVLLLSDRFRQRLRRFVSRHFERPQHDFRKVWMLFTERIAPAVDEASLSNATARLISETFDVLAVTVWLLDQERERLMCAASTSQASHDRNDAEPLALTAEASGPRLRSRLQPFLLEEIDEPWARALREANPTQFPNGGKRVALPLASGNQWLGVCVLADRVSGVPYGIEEFELLRCIGDQLGASLLKLKLTAEIMQARELEAFQTVSAFFVHDLKNAASSLNLMLKNLPIHFDDAAFREDALRALGATAARINSVIGKVSALRSELEMSLVELDLNELVRESIADLNGMSGGATIEADLKPVPRITADRERVRSVLTNLLLNARDAVAGGGEVAVRTHATENHAVLAVSDSGCGMSGDFVHRHLFRPFQTTKKQGIGIGMFQTKAIVDAHGGTIRVETELGKGSTFSVSLPITARPK